ncbi:MAG: hypothetical protein DRO67_06080, partial [Candidatus Asgardarchaeum californiense]
MLPHYTNGVIITPDERVVLTSQSSNTLDLKEDSFLSIETYVPPENDEKEEIEEEIKTVLGNYVVDCLEYLDKSTTSISINSFLRRDLSIFVYKLKKKCTFKIFDPLQNQILLLPLTYIYNNT